MMRSIAVRAATIFTGLVVGALAACQPASGCLQNGVPCTNASISFMSGGPYTVQDGGANPLSAASTSGLPPGTIAAISDLGGCGTSGANGFGFAMWNGSGWRRISRGTQATVSPSATIPLDYWKSPMRISITGSILASTRVLISNAPDGALYSVVKPGVAATLAAFSVNMSGAASTSDIAIVGPNANIFEVVGSVLNQVQAY